MRRVIHSSITTLMLPILFTVGCLLLTGCGAQKKNAKPATDASKSPLSTQRPDSVALSKLTTLRDRNAAKDPNSLSGPAQETEILTSAVNEQLKKVSHSIRSSKPIANHVFAESFRSTSLRQRTEGVFQDPGIVVRRSNSSHSNPASHTVDKKNFQHELNKLVNSLETKDCKLKVYSIHQNGDRLQTSVHVQIWGTNSRHAKQITADWNCGWVIQAETQVKLTSVAVVEYEETETDRNKSVSFEDATLAVFRESKAFQQQLRHGLDHWLDRFEQTYTISPTGYQGLAVGDANGDGLDDLFVAQPGGVIAGLPNLLFLQNPDGTLTDVSEISGLNWNTATHTALFVDLDNDGDQDLIVSTVMGLVFLENDGACRFTQRSAKLTPDAPPMSLAAADFDHDGDLDVYACCYANRTSSPLMGRPIPYHDANNGGRNALFRNEGKFQFRDVTKRFGLDQNNRRFSFAASWEDFDNDGDSDLYVANDYGRNNLFRNDNGQFVDVANELGTEDISAGMSVSWGDFNRDGWFDVYVSNMWSSAGNRIAYQRDFKSEFDANTRKYFQRHARGNSLFQNDLNSQNRFLDISESAAVTMGRWAWASGFADINSDGWEDLLVTNGFMTQEDTTDL